MKVYNYLIGALIFVFAAASISSCSSDDNEKSSTGKLSVRLTDAPFPSDFVSEANVTINKIEIRRADNSEDNPFIVLSEEEKSFNLLDLTNGITASLVSLDVPVGSYDLIRLYVVNSDVVMTDGTRYDMKIPSGEQTGIKVFVKPSIVVEGGLTAELLLDFDVSNSFVVKGNSSSREGIKGFNFKPVIKASNLSTAGRLEGKVVDSDDVAIDGAQISVIAADTVYTTALSNEEGAYAVLGLPEGTFNVKVEYKELLPVTEENVEITAGNSTELNLKFAE